MQVESASCPACTERNTFFLVVLGGGETAVQKVMINGHARRAAKLRGVAARGGGGGCWRRLWLPSAALWPSLHPSSKASVKTVFNQWAFILMLCLLRTFKKPVILWLSGTQEEGSDHWEDGEWPMFCSILCDGCWLLWVSPALVGSWSSGTLCGHQQFLLEKALVRVSGAATRYHNRFVPSSWLSARKQPIIMDLKSLNAFFSSSSFKVLHPRLDKYSVCTWRADVKYRLYVWIQIGIVWLLLSHAERATEKKCQSSRLGWILACAMISEASSAFRVVCFYPVWAEFICQDSPASLTKYWVISCLIETLPVWYCLLSNCVSGSNLKSTSSPLTCLVGEKEQKQHYQHGDFSLCFCELL